MFDLQGPISRSALDARHAVVNDFNSRILGSLQQQSIEHLAGKNRNGLLEMKGNAASGGPDQFTLLDPFAFDFGIAQERPLDQGFMGNAAAAGFLPGKFFVE